jgi:hypothetical protein
MTASCVKSLRLLVVQVGGINGPAGHRSYSDLTGISDWPQGIP